MIVNHFFEVVRPFFKHADIVFEVSLFVQI